MNSNAMKLVPQKYSGAVLAVEKDVAEVEVKIECGSECNGCRLSSACGKGPGCTVVLRANIIGKAPAVGDEVELTAEKNSSVHASFELLMLPLAVFILAAIVINAVGGNDLVAGLSAFASLLTTFVIIYLRQRYAKPIWTIKHNQI